MKKFAILLIIANILMMTAFADSNILPPAPYGGNSDFSDVSKSHWAYDNIEKVAKNGWFSGYTDGTFKPEAPIKRSEAAKVLAIITNKGETPTIRSCFSDVQLNSWYAFYIESVKDLFYNTEGVFRPNENITRADALYAMIKAYKYTSLYDKVDKAVVDKFVDCDFLDEEMKKSIAVGLAYGLVVGLDENHFGPESNLTRAQFASLISRISSIGYNSVTNTGILQYVRITSPSEGTVTKNSKIELHGEAVYSDGSTYDYTNHINAYSKENNVKIIGNKVYGMQSGQATVMFQNVMLKDEKIIIDVK